MRVVFEDAELQRLAEQPSASSRRWGADLAKALRKKVQVLRAAVDERDLYAMHSLRLEQLKGNRAGTSSIRLNGQFRLIIRFETDDGGRVVVVIELVDYH